MKLLKFGAALFFGISEFFDLSLPIPFPLPRNGVLQGRIRRHKILFAVADAAIIFAPRHF
jgi:hypothetical protein